jgi:hypothetical protein
MKPDGEGPPAAASHLLKSARGDQEGMGGGGGRPAGQSAQDGPAGRRQPSPRRSGSGISTLEIQCPSFLQPPEINRVTPA